MSNLEGRLEIDVEELKLILKFKLSSAHRVIQDHNLESIIELGGRLEKIDLAVIASLIKHSSDFEGNELDLLDKDLPIIELIEFFAEGIAKALQPKKKKPTKK